MKTVRYAYQVVSKGYDTDVSIHPTRKEARVALKAEKEAGCEAFIVQHVYKLEDSRRVR